MKKTSPNGQLNAAVAALASRLDPQSPRSGQGAVCGIGSVSKVRRGRGRPSFTGDPRFVVFLIPEIESWLAAQGRAGKPLSVAAACRNALLAESDEATAPNPPDWTTTPEDPNGALVPIRTVGTLGFSVPGATPLREIAPKNVRNRYYECLRWLAANADSPSAAYIAKWRAGRRLVADDLSKPPRFSVQP